MGDHLDLTVEELVAAADLLEVEPPRVLFERMVAPGRDALGALAASGDRFLSVRGLLSRSSEGVELDESVARCAELLAEPLVLACIAELGASSAVSWLCGDDADVAALSAVGDGVWRLRFVPADELVGAIAVLAELDGGWPPSSLGESTVRLSVPGLAPFGAREDVGGAVDDAVTSLDERTRLQVAALVGEDPVFRIAATMARGVDGDVRSATTTWVVHRDRGGHVVEVHDGCVELRGATPDMIVASIEEGLS